MARNGKTIEVPVQLVRLLLAEPKDYKNPAKYAEAQGLAKTMLHLLVDVNDVRPAKKPVSKAARAAMSEGMRKFWARRKAGAAKK